MSAVIRKILWVRGAQSSLNNNTPVNTEVLWGGGVWWGAAKGHGPHCSSKYSRS